MKRFEELNTDYELDTIIELMGEHINIIKRLNHRISILEESINIIGSDELDTIHRESKKNFSKNGQYDYIPIDIKELLDMFFNLEGILSIDADFKHSDLIHRPVSVVEVGCGIGRNIHILSSTDRFHFDKIAGFDIHSEYIEIGKKYFSLEDSLFVDDCMCFDFSGYDIVYFYKPFKSETKQRKFEDYLVSSCKVGAYIIGCLHSKLDKYRRLIPKDDVGSIWKKV